MKKNNENPQRKSTGILNLFLLLPAFMGTFFIGTFAQTTLLNYNYNSGASYGVLTYAPAAGITSSMTSSTLSFGTSSGIATTATAFTQNVTAGNALNVTSLGNAGTNFGKYYQFQIGGASLNQYINFNVYFQSRSTQTGPPDFKVEYSINNGGMWTTGYTASAINTGNWVVHKFSLPLVVNYPTSIYIRITPGKAGSNSGTFKIDNFQLQGTISPPIGPGQWLKLCAGFGHVVGLGSDNKAWAWGDNNSGSLGIGNNVNKNFPVQISALGNACSSVSTRRGEHNLALKTNGSLWAWGSNSYGELGNNTTMYSNIPVQENSLATDWSKIFAGYSSSFAIKTNGTLWAWGFNGDGILGDGTNINRSSPKQIGGDTDWLLVSSSGGHTLALKQDGSLYAWGSNNNLQYGTGNVFPITPSSLVPIKIGNDKWLVVAAGNDFSLGIKKDGTLWSWGYSNFNGCLGIGNGTGTGFPQKIGNANNLWLQIEIGNNSCYAIRSDNTLWAWGSNVEGQLGDGTTINRNTPVMIGLITDKWASISGGYGFKANGGFAIGVRSTDKTKYCTTGSNTYGQLGNGTVISQQNFICQNGGISPRIGNPDEMQENEIGQGAILNPSGKEEYFFLYPNPTNGKINMEFGLTADNQKVSLDVYNHLGVKVFEEMNIPAYSGNNKISLGFSSLGLSPGIYFIRMVNGDVIKSQKVLYNK